MSKSDICPPPSPQPTPVKACADFNTKDLIAQCPLETCKTCPASVTNVNGLCIPVGTDCPLIGCDGYLTSDQCAADAKCQWCKGGKTGTGFCATNTVECPAVVCSIYNSKNCPLDSCQYCGSATNLGVIGCKSLNDACPPPCEKRLDAAKCGYTTDCFWCLTENVCKPVNTECKPVSVPVECSDPTTCGSPRPALVADAKCSRYSLKCAANTDGKCVWQDFCEIPNCVPGSCGIAPVKTDPTCPTVDKTIVYDCVYQNGLCVLGQGRCPDVCGPGACEGLPVAYPDTTNLGFFCKEWAVSCSKLTADGSCQRVYDCLIKSPIDVPSPKVCAAADCANLPKPDCKCSDCPNAKYDCVPSGDACAYNVICPATHDCTDADCPIAAPQVGANVLCNNVKSSCTRNANNICVRSYECPPTVLPECETGNCFESCYDPRWLGGTEKDPSGTITPSSVVQRLFDTCNKTCEYRCKASRKCARFPDANRNPGPCGFDANDEFYKLCMDKCNGESAPVDPPVLDCFGSDECSCAYQKGCVFVLAVTGDPPVTKGACRTPKDALVLYNSLSTSKANYFPSQPSWCNGAEIKKEVLNALQERLEKLNEAVIQQKLNEIIKQAPAEVLNILDKYVISVKGVFRTENVDMSLQIEIKAGSAPAAADLEKICDALKSSVKGAAVVEQDYKCTLTLTAPANSAKRAINQQPVSLTYDAALEALNAPGSASSIFVSVTLVLLGLFFVLF